MNMPGFTAGFSLHKTDELYRILRVHRSTESVPQHAITAQFIHRPPVDCDFMECYQVRGYFVCYCG
jgi:hypothetical protein